MAKGKSKKAPYSYGKRPLWQWIVLYLIIGIIVYGAIYYFIFAKMGNYSYNPDGAYQSQKKTTVEDSQMKRTPADTIFITKKDAAKGTYLADPQGMTLYIFDKDTNGFSNCYDKCASLWPAYVTETVKQLTYPETISVITRSDGSKQYAWKGKPLYYYANDAKPGDLNGDGIGGIWHIIKP